MPNLPLEVLKRILAMPDDNSRTRGIIIIDLALGRCKELREEGKDSWKVAEENRRRMQELQSAFLQLAQEEKIELNLVTGKVTLTDAGKKVLEEAEPKTGPP